MAARLGALNQGDLRKQLVRGFHVTAKSWQVAAGTALARPQRRRQLRVALEPYGVGIGFGSLVGSTGWRLPLVKLTPLMRNVPERLECGACGASVVARLVFAQSSPAP